jgi:hypothetical protein
MYNIVDRCIAAASCDLVFIGHGQALFLYLFFEVIHVQVASFYYVFFVINAFSMCSFCRGDLAMPTLISSVRVCHATLQ